MIRNYTPVPPQVPSPVTLSSSPMLTNMVPSTLHQQPEPSVNVASKVAEVFLTAGHAFQKLGDLTLQLHTNNDTDECKWTEKDVESLRDALTRFAHELDTISESVQGRTTKHIKTDIKRRHLLTEEVVAARRPPSPGMLKRPMMASGSGMQMGPKRMAIALPPGTKPLTLAGSRPYMSLQQGTRIVSSSQLSPAVPMMHDVGHHYISQ